MRQNSIQPRQEPPGGGYFVRRAVRPGELPSLMNKHIITGTLGSAWGNLITGIIYVYFGNAVGLNQLQWGILGGISAWVVLMQPLGAMLGERAGSRKFVWFWTALVDRVIRMVGIVCAFFLWRAGNHAAYLLFMIGICAGTLVGNLSQGPWFGWLSTIIPQNVHGTFWGRRDSWISLIVIGVSLPSGLLMDLVPEQSKLTTAFVLLIGASLLGFTDILIHGTIPEPPHQASRSGKSLSGILAPLRDKRFRPWLVFTFFWNLGQSLGGALCTLYFMENLGFQNNLLAGMIAITVLGLVGTLVASRRVGRMVDRFGIKRMLMLGYFFWSFLPAIWLFATPSTAVIWISIASFIGGVFPAAANNAGVKLVTRFPAAEDSGMYMAVSTTVGSITGGIGSIVAGTFLSVMGGWSFSVVGLVVSAFPLLFMISFILRLLTVFALLPRVNVTGAPPEDDRRFLLPLFFESVPGIDRLVRNQGKGRIARQRRNGTGRGRP